MGSTCVSGGVVHSRALTRQVTHSVPSQTGRLPEEFLWLVLISRGCPRTSYPANRAGVPNRLLSGVDGPHGQSKAPSRAARRRAGAFTPRGPRPRAFYVPGGLAVPRAPLTGAVRCCRQNDVMNLSRSTSDGSPWEGKPCGLSTIRSLSSSLRFVNPFFSSGEVRFWPVLEDKGSRPDQDLTPHLRLCQPPFLKEENRGEPAPEDKGPRVIRMLLPIPRPCQPLFWRRRTVVRSP